MLRFIKKKSVWMYNNPMKTIVFVAIFIRLIVAFFYRHITVYPDTTDYYFLAERILAMDLVGYEGQRSPGYPLLICLAGKSFPVLVILQNIIGIITVLLSYKLLLICDFSKKWALNNTLLIAVYLPVIFFEFAILSETLTLFVIMMVAYLITSLKSNSDGSISRYICLGLSLTYLVAIKPFYIFIPVVLFLYLIVQKLKLKYVITRYSFVLLLPLFMYFGWSYTNYKNTGYFVPTTFYGFNIAQNCVSFAEKTTPEYDEIGKLYAKYRDANIAIDRNTAMSIWEAYPELKQQTRLSFPNLSNRLYDYSMVTIKMNKVDYLKQVAISWTDFWKTSLYYHYDNFAIENSNILFKYICLMERIIIQLIKIIFILLIPFNVFQSIRKRQLSPTLLIGIIVLTASLLQAFATYGTNSRFSFPFEILIVCSVLLNLKEWKRKKVEI